MSAPGPAPGGATFGGRVALVTGAGSGIGRATAALFAARGGAVVAADVREAAARETAAGVRAAGGDAEGVRCDVTCADDVAGAVEQARRAFGRLDVVVHCAGILRVAPLEETGEKEWAEVLSVNLTGAFLVTRAALRALRAQGGGAIVHIASRAAIRAKEGHGAYSAAKAGILQLTQMAALEGAPHRIRVNCVCPGFIDTPMTRGGYDAGAVESWSRVCPLGRAGTPEDVARAMLFLASDEAAFITGVALPVDGGRTIL
ncbi:MAG TPA: SDR family NAD(P)-dependent oxidoreductase [Methylomirabilota bacterium]|nr:SDR family NAD(P)-dependent oxidoreductase [Methylomirabilota bacterium]